VYERRATPADMPIPHRLNCVLVLVVCSSAVGLLWLGSWFDRWYAILAVGVAFSYLLLTDYALLHEAAHHMLHPHRTTNRVLGTAAGLFFPCPFSMIEAMHQGHHLRNRTDHEMFDLYYPTDNRLVRFVQWYGILCGLFWPFVPLGAVLFAACPRLLRSKVFRQARSSSYLLGDVRGSALGAIRAEVALTIALFAALFWLLDLKWPNVLLMYACFAFNWSTRQYVGHAFSKRDVIEGAYNLRHNRLMSWILLNGNWDLNHHRHPEASWYYLPRVSQPGDPTRPGYVRQYWRLWRGPRLNTEPAPEALQALPLSIHG
jgi:fatty acid desaturase